MSAYERSHPSQSHRPDGRNVHEEAEPPLGDLLRRFAQDAGALVRHEIALAKLELRDNLKGYAQNAVKLGAAAGVGLLGALAFTAFLVIGLGSLINNYWLSALVVAVVLLGVAAVLARVALAHMRRQNVTPETSVESIKQDQQWAKREARDFKRKLQA